MIREMKEKRPFLPRRAGPFVKAVNRNQATPLFPGLPKKRFVGGGFKTGIDDGGSAVVFPSPSGRDHSTRPVERKNDRMLISRTNIEAGLPGNFGGCRLDVAKHFKQKRQIPDS